MKIGNLLQGRGGIIEHGKEVMSGKRFEFGANLALCFKELNEDRIRMAED